MTVIDPSDICPEPYAILRIENADRQMVINIPATGKTEFGPGFQSNDQAARLFWECVGGEYVSMKFLLQELVNFVENHKALKGADPVQALVEAKRILSGDRGFIMGNR